MTASVLGQAGLHLKISEDFRLLTALQDAAKRGIAAGIEGVAQCPGFAFARGQHPDFARGGQGGIAQRDAARRRFRPSHRAVNHLRLDGLGVTREQRGNVGILPHAEEHEIDHRLAKRLANR